MELEDRDGERPSSGAVCLNRHRQCVCRPHFLPTPSKRGHSPHQGRVVTSSFPSQGDFSTGELHVLEKNYRLFHILWNIHNNQVFTIVTCLPVWVSVQENKKVICMLRRTTSGDLWLQASPCAGRATHWSRAQHPLSRRPSVCSHAGCIEGEEQEPAPHL